MDTALELFLENTGLQVLLAGAIAIAAMAWAFGQVVEAKDRSEWRRAADLKAQNPVVPIRARRGGSTGDKNAFGAVREALLQNEGAIEGYEKIPSEVFASRVWEVSDLFNPHRQSEWIWDHEPAELKAAADFVEDLGCPDIANRLRDFLPYHEFYASLPLDEDLPENAPGEAQYSESATWLEENSAWKQVLDKVNAELEGSYPWSDPDRDGIADESRTN